MARFSPRAPTGGRLRPRPRTHGRTPLGPDAHRTEGDLSGYLHTIVVIPLARIGDAMVFAARAIREACRPPYEIQETARQLHEIGWKSVPLVAAAGFAVGIVLSMHTRASLERFGAEALIPAALALALVRETGPLVVGLLVSGRVGAGVGAELGAMKVTEQIDALEATAVDSFKFLVVTRVVACVFAMPILTVIMNFTGIIGGWVAELAISGVEFWPYFRSAFSLIEFTDYLPSTLKTMVFGFIIATTASYLGVHTTGGTQGVGQAATRSVVMASILIIATNVVLVRLIFFIFPETSQ